MGVDGTSLLFTLHCIERVFLLLMYRQIALLLCLLNDLNVSNECVTCNFNYLFVFNRFSLFMERRNVSLVEYTKMAFLKSVIDEKIDDVHRR